MQIKVPVKIKGFGAYVPPDWWDNKKLEEMVDTSDEWIQERTGIKKRHILLDKSKATSDLGFEAAKKALEVANVKPENVEFITFATFTPDYLMPATGAILQHKLGARAGACDIQIACSGFVYSFSLTASLVAGGLVNNALVVAGETMSRAIDWTDRNICVLFGDGAGAVYLEKDEKNESGILASVFGADGSEPEKLYIPAGGSKKPFNAENAKEIIENKENFMQMKGREIFKFSVRIVPQIIEDLLNQAGLEKDDVKMWFLHQANKRIIQSAAKRIGISMDKMFINIDKYANTSAGTIPIALYEAYSEGLIKEGDIIGMIGFGGGLSWGGILLKL